MTLRSGVFAWWRAAERAAGALTAPRVDIAATDDALDRLLAGSAIANGVVSLRDAFARAWPGSSARRLLFPVAREVAALPLVERVRIAGAGAAIGGVTAVALIAVQPRSPGVAVAVLPGAFALAGAIAAAAAPALTRALDARVR